MGNDGAGRVKEGLKQWSRGAGAYRLPLTRTQNHTQWTCLQWAPGYLTMVRLVLSNLLARWQAPKVFGLGLNGMMLPGESTAVLRTAYSTSLVGRDAQPERRKLYSYAPQSPQCRVLYPAVTLHKLRSVFPERAPDQVHRSATRHRNPGESHPRLV